MYQVLGYYNSGSQDVLYSGDYSQCVVWMSRQCDTELYAQGYRRWELKSVIKPIILTEDQIKSYWWKR